MSKDNNYASLRAEMQKADQANGRPVYESIPKLYIDRDGTWRLRICPSNTKASRVPFQIYKLHFYKNPNFPESTSRAPWVCADRGCPMCSVAFKTAKEEKENKVEKDHRTAWKKFARPTAHYHVMDMDNGGALKVLNADKNEQYESALHDEIVKEIDALMSQEICPFDADDGRIMVITRRTVQGKKIYSVKFEMESHALPQAIRDQLRRVRPLDKIHWRYTTDQLQKVLDGISWRRNDQAQSDASDEADTSRPARTKVQASATPSPAESARESLFPTDEEVPHDPSEGAESDDDIDKLKADIFGPSTKKVTMF